MQGPSRVPFLILLTGLVLAGCSIVREEPAPQGGPLSGVWRGDVEWLQVEILMSQAGDTLTGTAFVTQNPIEGLWSGGAFHVTLSTNSNTALEGTWKADWGEGTLRGIMSYPLLALNLEAAAADGARVAVARFSGGVDGDGRTLLGQLTRDGMATEVRLRHEAPLPVHEVEVSGRLIDDLVTFHIGTAYNFAGNLMSGALVGVVEAHNVASYRLVLLPLGR